MTRSLLAILSTLLPVMASQGVARTVSVDFTGGVNTTVRGVYVIKDYWFELSEDWLFVEPSVLDLRFSHSSILNRELSSLTVSVNSSALKSILLDRSNEKDAALVVSVPAKVLKGGMNVLTLTIKMRSDLKDLCDDVHNPALWILIGNESRLDVSYEEKRVEPDLAGFPADYANPDLLYSSAKERVHAVIVIPDEPSAAELEAVGALATLFGQEIGLGRGEFRVVPLSQADDGVLRDRQVVVVGSAHSLGAFASTPWSIPADAFTRDGAGWLVETRSPFNPHRRMLIVAGRDDDALRLVAAHLKTPSSVRNLKGPAAAFDRLPEFEVTTATDGQAAFVVRLKDLKMSDLMARGKFYHSLNFTLPNPFVGRIKDGAFLRLSMSHSELLLPQSSSLLVKVNGEPVKSIRLTRETASRNTWDVRIPLQYLGSRWLSFDVEMFLDIGDPDCYYNHPEMAWLTLHNDTFLYLPVDTGQEDTMANYPYCFLSWNSFNNLAVVMIGQLTSGTLSGAFNILAYLAQSLRSPVHAEVMFGRLTDLPEGATRGNLILVGPLSSLLSDQTWAAVLPKELTERSRGRVDLLNTAGILSFAKSPLSPSKKVLAVVGRSDKEIGLAAPYLFRTGFVEWVRGILAVVLPDKELRVLLPPSYADAVAQFDPTKIRLDEKDGKIVPVLEIPKPQAPPSRGNVAFLVFGLIAPVLVLLVVLRLRAMAKEGRKLD